MVDVDINIKLDSPCAAGRDFCINCHSHFMTVRPRLKGVVVSKHFLRDLKDQEEVNSIVKEVLDCSGVDFHELHKFEENVEGNMIFRAKRDGVHVVYCVNKEMRIIFLRAFKNYSDYGKFLEDKKEIRKMLKHV